MPVSPTIRASRTPSPSSDMGDMDTLNISSGSRSSLCSAPDEAVDVGARGASEEMNGNRDAGEDNELAQSETPAVQKETAKAIAQNAPRPRSSLASLTTNGKVVRSAGQKGAHSPTMSREDHGQTLQMILTRMKRNAREKTQMWLVTEFSPVTNQGQLL